MLMKIRLLGQKCEKDLKTYNSYFSGHKAFVWLWNGGNSQNSVRKRNIYFFKLSHNRVRYHRQSSVNCLWLDEHPTTVLSLWIISPHSLLNEMSHSRWLHLSHCATRLPTNQQCIRTIQYLVQLPNLVDKNYFARPVIFYVFSESQRLIHSCKSFKSNQSRESQSRVTVASYSRESQSRVTVANHSRELQSRVTVASHSHESESLVTVASQSCESQSRVTVASHRRESQSRVSQSRLKVTSQSHKLQLRVTVASYSHESQSRVTVTSHSHKSQS
jgi:hypothetical protein